MTNRTTTFLTGDKALDRALKEIGGKISQKAIAAGVRAGLSEMRKAMRAATPNSSARKTIAARFKRRKKFGTTEAKVGAGVGKHKGGKGGTNGGVGISKQNAHWYFMGTNSRVTNKNGADRGAMPKADGVRIGAAVSGASALMKLQKKTRQVLEKEAAKVGRR
jgi:hypothetical protein